MNLHNEAMTLHPAHAHRFALLTLLALALPALGQLWEDGGAKTRLAGDHDRRHLGFPEDWSSRHVVMTGDNAAAAVAAGSREPRHVYNMVRRQAAAAVDPIFGPWRPRARSMKIDWAVSLENGFVSANQFPAKYRFDVNAQSCNGDYVVFGLTVAPGSQANLVGISNLYTEASPPCNGGKPWVAFAYNTATQTGGRIRTSPTISTDGAKVAFVESANSGSFFHVLVLPNPIPVPPQQQGTVLSPSNPTSCTTTTAPNCMTTVQISTATNTDSSPYIDYSTDTAYVGTDNGRLYKITPVFGGGTPQVISDANWPVTVVTSGSSTVVTDPIVDGTAGRIFMGDLNGYLYAISLSNPAHATSARVIIGWVGHGAGTGVIDAPIVVTDSANPAVEQVFAFTGCSNVVGIGGAITQVPANFTSSFTATTSNTVDLGSASGRGDCTTGNVHVGAFDNRFWLNGSSNGHILGCGFVSGTNGNPLIPSNPKMYMFPFDATHTITSNGSTSWVVNNTVGDECSPLTEFFNGATDRMFFGVGSTSDGFVESSTLTGTASQPNCNNPPTSTCVTAPRALGGASGIVVDNQVSNGGTNIYFSTQAAGTVNGGNCRVSGGSTNPYCAVKLTQSALQ